MMADLVKQVFFLQVDALWVGGLGGLPLSQVNDLLLFARKLLREHPLPL